MQTLGQTGSPGRTLWQKFYEDGRAECLECEAVGKVRKSKEGKYRIIVWKRKGAPRYAERWDDRFSTVPVVCEKCWVVMEKINDARRTD